MDVYLYLFYNFTISKLGGECFLLCYYVMPTRSSFYTCLEDIKKRLFFLFIIPPKWHQNTDSGSGILVLAKKHWPRHHHLPVSIKLWGRLCVNAVIHSPVQSQPELPKYLAYERDLAVSFCCFVFVSTNNNLGLIKQRQGTKRNVPDECIIYMLNLFLND